MLIPQIPNLASGQVVNAANLNAIASACTFLLGKPMCRLHDSAGGHAITTAYSDMNGWNVADINVESSTKMWASGTAASIFARTAGWFKVRYSIQISSTSAGRTVNAKAVATSGNNNPLGSGVTLANCLLSYVQVANTPAVTSFCGSSGVIPVYLYPGDGVKIRLIGDAAGATTGADASQPNSCFSMEFVSA